MYRIVCQIYDFERVLLEILGPWSFFLLIPRDNVLLYETTKTSGIIEMM